MCRPNSVRMLNTSFLFEPFPHQYLSMFSPCVACIYKCTSLFNSLLNATVYMFRKSIIFSLVLIAFYWNKKQENECDLLCSFLEILYYIFGEYCLSCTLLKLYNFLLFSAYKIQCKHIINFVLCLYLMVREMLF